MAKLELTTGPTDRPIRTDKTAEWLRETDPSRFETISDLIDSAIEELEREHWTQFVSAVFTQYFDGWPADYFVLRLAPVSAVASLKYLDADGAEQTVASTVWELGEEDRLGIIRLQDGQSWPTDCRGAPDDIYAQFTAGYGTAADVPAPIKHALKIHVAQAYAFPDGASPLRLSNPATTVASLMRKYSFRRQIG